MNNKFLKIFVISMTIVFTLVTFSCDQPTKAETTGNIQGIIYDGGTLMPLGGAIVTTSPTTSSKISDSSGAYSIEGIEPAEYTVQVVKSGFESNYTNIGVIAGETSIADIQLTPLVPHLAVSLSDLNFGTSTNSLSFIIENDGVGTVTYSVTHSESWITVTPPNGSVTDESDVVYVDVDRSGRPSGNYFGTLNISSNTNNEVINVIMVVPNPDQPQLSSYPTSLNFETNIDEMFVWISNTGTGILTWNIIDDRSWITIVPQSGTVENETDEIIISVDRVGQQPGDYTGLITINSDGGNQLINVNMEVPSIPTLSVSPSELDFNENTNSLTFVVNNVGAGDLNWIISDNQQWIITTPNSGINYGTVNVTVSRDEISPGDYSGAVTISSNGGTEYVEVLMNSPADEPPTEIQLLSPTDVTENSMTLNWTRNFDSDFAAYKVYRDLSPAVTQSSELITTITSSAENYYTDTGLQASTTYFYRVYVMDMVNQHTSSNVMSATTLTQLGNWSVNATLGTTLYAVDALNENFAVAVGENGVVFYYNGTEWTEETSPTSSDINDIDIVSQTDIWAVGNDIYHYDGINWSVAYESSACYSIDIVSANDIYVGSTSGKIYHYDGSDWSFTTLDASIIMDIQMDATDSGWAMDYYGNIFYYNGYGWSYQYECPNPNFDFYSRAWTLFVFNSSDIWVGGEGNQSHGLYHYNGSDWISQISNYDILSIGAFSSSSIWFVGGSEVYPYASCSIYYWNGNELQSIIPPTSYTLFNINMMSETDGWAVGYGGVVLRYH
jgi:hypothetical protein